jgi:hypothetical protein
MFVYVLELCKSEAKRGYQESLKIMNPGVKVRPARKADNFAAIY